MISNLFVFFLSVFFSFFFFFYSVWLLFAHEWLLILWWKLCFSHTGIQKRCLSHFLCRVLLSFGSSSFMQSNPPQRCSWQSPGYVDKLNRTYRHVLRKEGSCVSWNNTHPYADPQDGERLVAMVNAWIYESLLDSGTFLSLVYMRGEPAVAHESFRWTSNIELISSTVCLCWHHWSNF